MRRISSRKWRWWIAGSSAMLVIFVTMISLAPLPLGATRRLAVAESNWVLTDYVKPTTGIWSTAGNGARKLAATYLEYQAIAGFRASHQFERRGEIPDVMRELVALKGTMLNQAEVSHLPASWPAIVSGLGYCDQLNGMAAVLLSREYGRSQLVGLFDPEKRSGHTIGRVWSANRREWLYFDVWATPVLFRLDGDGHPQILARDSQYVATVSPELQADIEHLYSFAASGFVFNEYRPSFGGYVASKLFDAARSRSVAAARPSGVTSVSLSQRFSTSGIGSLTPKHPEADASTRRLYIQARLDHLFGKSALAAREYDEVSRTTHSIFADASRLMKARLVAGPTYAGMSRRD